MSPRSRVSDGRPFLYGGLASDNLHRNDTIHLSFLRAQSVMTKARMMVLLLCGLTFHSKAFGLSLFGGKVFVVGFV
ncbi:hypothetical protein T4D_16365 [Trichinella pseudospiralis]|uniref:Uncharacterized protein n=1 Tax=Trichinella pseudospiralis TaxID=6337 RepID=A0A0V1FSS1_TRIPS|nr:hypothetical protein T4D_16647 [Trichinella pseudospiralis]KRY87863.1 hypothetical protein T4D_16061 [Trichinella pseudospiralis]KRY89096.1 hypothetical protein T4D_16365 [Trichinella pseudospiralis]